MRDSRDEMTMALERLRRMVEESKRPQATMTRKGSTLYVVSQEARELRRVDRILEEV